ncbi:glutathione peroxidase [Aquimarina sediminis]|uniref:glutathione peroxidase n=1 Tax=Aquimarina sediminis TaxID=2070536 RepID=UPI000CA005CB|nr:glutathione peroxidase [Aquimarina sediminis]
METLKTSVYDISIKDILGKPVDLRTYKGMKILFVNVASKCGFTKQYKGLQELYNTYKDTLMVVAVPCNQFGGQEPANATEIRTFCELNYGVTFLVTEKIKVKGDDQHALYQWLTRKRLNGKSNSSVKWNFQKYLLDEEGELIDYFYSITSPKSAKITRHL